MLGGNLGSLLYGDVSVMGPDIVNKPPITPYNKIIIGTFGDQVDKKKPVADKRAPNIATGLEPNSRSRTLDMVPARHALVY